MSKPFVPVRVLALGATPGGFAVFLGNGEKAFLMLIDREVGTGIALALQGAPLPIQVRGDVWDRLEDVSELLRKLQEGGPQAEGEGKDEDEPS